MQMARTAEFDLIVHGASGFTGRLIAEHLARHAPAGLRWAMSGRSVSKLTQVRDEIGARDVPLLEADASDRVALDAVVARTRVVLSSVGPYQLYGSELVGACAQAGVDYLDLSGEPTWMATMIARHHETARASGARIVHSCGFDSVPFEMGVYYVQEAARAKWGAPASRVRGRIRALKGGLSGGTVASGAATMSAMQKDPTLFGVLTNPFALTPGFQGPEQPRTNEPSVDEDLGPVVPFMMAVINSKNVHRSNMLMGHAYGRDFVYDEMALAGSGAAFQQAERVLAPGEGPTREERDAGSYDIAFLADSEAGEKIVVSVHGDKDPGYGSTSKIAAETALALLEAPDTEGGVWTPVALLRQRLVARLSDRAGLTLKLE